LVPGPLSDYDQFQGYQYSADLRDQTDKAFADGNDDLASRLLDEQDSEAMRSLMEVQMRGGDPVSETTPRAAFIDPVIETKRRAFAMFRQESQLEKIFDEGGVKVLDDAFLGYREAYKLKNEAKLITWKADMSPEEQVAYARQLEPHVVDPNEIAEHRQAIVRMDQAMKAVSEAFGFHSSEDPGDGRVHLEGSWPKHRWLLAEWRTRDRLQGCQHVAWVRA